MVRNASLGLSEVKTVFADGVGQEVLGWGKEGKGKRSQLVIS